jgi:hypothetical protein
LHTFRSRHVLRSRGVGVVKRAKVAAVTQAYQRRPRRWRNGRLRWPDPGKANKSGVPQPEAEPERARSHARGRLRRLSLLVSINNRASGQGLAGKHGGDETEAVCENTTTVSVFHTVALPSAQRTYQQGASRRQYVLARPAERTWTRGRMALSATRGLRCKPSSTSRPSLGPSLQPWPPDGQHTHRGLADVHEATATTPPGSADTYPVPHDPLAQKVPNYGAVPREAAPLLLKDITEDVSTCASAVRRVTCGCPVM